MGQRRHPADLAERCEPIELLIVDVDGVLTDGVIAVDDRGVETKHFHVRDGLGFALWHRAGKRSAILSGRRTEAVERRAAELKIAHVLQGHDEKAGPFAFWSTARSVAAAGLLRRRRPARPAGAPGRRAGRLPGRCRGRGAGRRTSRHPSPGGRGAVREVVEVILKWQGKWPAWLNPGPAPSVRSIVRTGRCRRGAALPTDISTEGTTGHFVFKKLLKAVITFALLLGCYLAYVRAFKLVVHHFQAYRRTDMTVFIAAPPDRSSTPWTWPSSRSARPLDRHQRPAVCLLQHRERGFWMYALRRRGDPERTASATTASG